MKYKKMSDFKFDPKDDRSYYPDKPGESWWCETHNRKAEWMFQNPIADPRFNQPEHRCDPNLGGITMPCLCRRTR